MTAAHPAPTTAPHPLVDRPEHVRADVAVVGAGVIGLATAWELRRRGRSVVVVDPEPGSGASRAAAGMLAPVSEVQYQQEPLYPLMTASAAEYPAFVAALEQAAGGTVGHRATETLVCGVDAADRQALADLRALQGRHGMTVEPLTLRAARTLEPTLSPRLSAVFRIPDDHQVDPRRLVAGLLAALVAPELPDPPELPEPAGLPAARDGGPARLVHDLATGLRRNAEGAATGVRLAGGGMVSATWTVLAPGAGLGELEGLPEDWHPPLRPVHGDILRARVPAGAPELLERTVRGLVHGVPVYLVPRADGTVVIGATSREDDLSGPSAGGVFRLLRDAQALVPGVADLELVEVLARARPGTPDDIPYFGRVRDPDGSPVPGLVVSTGYFRHGVLLAPLAARLAAQLVTGGTGADLAADAEHLATTDPHRFDRPVEARPEDPAPAAAGPGPRSRSTR
ncbi:FAD-dependent oxidoreductase [Kocuria rosea]|uniref:FAD-dependent oxidoreductase n=1 Tax=Kocuria rosea TaxID=1275 RepID=UPI000D65E885|nr:FAD-dependent oxidoreductase [Kocuria rosea]PWF82808.1 glycine oxidase ThiO [Kocuria rosea]PWF84754.1 glycine oxidase ThiO [Kocuria rosea]QCY31638.1 FAD-dependent oxidoreductase [Kocuria rosea]TQN39044.1 glycine oxidase [Kocuria rosea]